MPCCFAAWVRKWTPVDAAAFPWRRPTARAKPMKRLSQSPRPTEPCLVTLTASVGLPTSAWKPETGRDRRRRMSAAQRPTFEDSFQTSRSVVWPARVGPSATFALPDGYLQSSHTFESVCTGASRRDACCRAGRASQMIFAAAVPSSIPAPADARWANYVKLAPALPLSSPNVSKTMRAAQPLVHRRAVHLRVPEHVDRDLGQIDRMRPERQVERIDQTLRQSLGDRGHHVGPPQDVTHADEVGNGQPGAALHAGATDQFVDLAVARARRDDHRMLRGL